MRDNNDAHVDGAEAERVLQKLKIDEELASAF